MHMLGHAGTLSLGRSDWPPKLDWVHLESNIAKQYLSPVAGAAMLGNRAYSHLAATVCPRQWEFLA